MRSALVKSDSTGRASSCSARAALALLFTAAALGHTAYGCARAGSLGGSLPATGQPSVHAVHDERVRRVMGELNRLRFSRMPQEIDSGREKARRLKQVAIAASSMERAASFIPEVLPELELNEEEAALFLTLVTRYRTRAKDLEASAKTGRISSVRTALSELTETCLDCHRAFRLTPLPEP